jgi:hypothetical protein
MFVGKPGVNRRKKAERQLFLCGKVAAQEKEIIEAALRVVARAF